MVELLFELGLGDRVVGVGDYAHWPPEVELLPHLGGLLDPHLEEIARLRPDLVLLLRSEAELGRKLEQLGIASLVVPADTLDEVEAAFGLVARRCGVEPAGRRAADAWRKALAPRPSPTTRRVLLVVGRPQGKLREVFVAGPGTFLSELAELAGAENIFADVHLAYPQVGLDSIVARDPQLILELQGEVLDPAEETALKADWAELLGKTPRVEVLSGSHVLVPGPRIPQLLDELAEALESHE